MSDNDDVFIIKDSWSEILKEAAIKEIEKKIQNGKKISESEESLLNKYKEK